VILISVQFEKMQYVIDTGQLTDLIEITDSYTMVRALTVSVITVLATCTLCLVTGELFTALVDLERILHAEYDVAQDLKSYIEREQQRISLLKRYLMQFLHSFSNHCVWFMPAAFISKWSVNAVSCLFLKTVSIRI
jgi:hypothetical protein